MPWNVKERDIDRKKFELKNRIQECEQMILTAKNRENDPPVHPDPLWEGYQIYQESHQEDAMIWRRAFRCTCQSKGSCEMA